ncbi:hypothetical protein Patl1_26795 [Pistacia atlantica]|uniref:Uncharacterized protein n=1 Tax=Pistacia atlantica TaxID=434234 RepID=A0ACC1AYZ9_9ROSI|nr:hypothetical protein Patl1_26795 [Pistacia atlantica]
MNRFFFFIFLIGFLFSQTPTLSFHIPFCWSFQVHIINNLTHNNLVIHCHSESDDLRAHELRWGDEFTFKLGQSPLKNTCVWCNVTKFGSNHIASINVFTKGLADHQCCKTKQCYWSASDDGFYFGNNNKTWTKRLDWY